MKHHKPNRLRPLSFIALALLFIVYHVPSLQARDKAKSADPDKKTAPTGLLGSWRAADLDSDSLKQVDFINEDGVVIMAIWGAVGRENGISPSGIMIPLPISLVKAKALAPRDPAIVTTFDHKFRDTTYTIELVEKSLSITFANKYKDSSNRDRTYQRHFVPGIYSGPSARGNASPSTVLPSSGWLGHWRNTDRNSRGTLELQIRDLGNVVMSTWSSMGDKISTSPTSSVVLPINGDNAASAKGKQDLKAEEDFGYSKRFYQLKLKDGLINMITYIDYVDPKRPDREVSDTFERGPYTAPPVKGNVSAQTPAKKSVFIKNKSTGNANPSGEEIIYEKEVGIQVEYIKLDHTRANELVKKFSSKANDAQELRDGLEALINQNQAQLIETTWIRARSGQRAKTESVREDIYPTSFGAPSSLLIAPSSANPNARDTTNKNQKSPVAYLTSAYPIKWETRNVGTTLEVDPVINRDGTKIDLSLSPEIVTRLGERPLNRENHKDAAQGTEHISMPEFYTIKDTLNISVTPGNFSLLGIHTPQGEPEQRILALLKADLILIPFKNEKSKIMPIQKNGKQGPVQIGVQVEYFSLEHRKANELLGKFAPKAHDVQELRDILGQLIKTDEASLIETTWVRSGSGQRAKSESVKEVVYATEFAAPGLPNLIDPSALPKNDGKAGGKAPTKAITHNKPETLITSASPTKWYTRQVGATLEVDPVVGSTGNMIHVSLSPEIVTQLEDQHFTGEKFEDQARGVGHITMPTFYLNKVTTQIVTAPGKYNLLSIHTPHDDASKRILVLLKSDLISP